VDVTALVVLFCTPLAVLVTFTPNVQDELAVKLAPDKLMLFDPAVAVIAPPPQPPVRPLGVETISPLGSVSVTPIPLSVFVPFGFVMLKLRLVVPFGGIVAAPNTFVIAGGCTTVRLADPVPPLPPSVDVTAPVVLFCAPAAVPVTFTLNVHDALAASVAPVRLTLPDAATAVIVPPPQAPVTPLGVAIRRPAGSESVNPTPVSVWPALGLLTVKLKVVAPSSGIVAAPKVVVMPGGEITPRVAVAALPVPALPDVTAPVVLTMLPADVPVTFTLNMHEPFPAMLAADNVTLFDPGAAVMDPPPHDPVRPFGVATTRPAGNISVNPTPVSPTVSALAMVKLRLVVPLTGIRAAPNDFVIEGGTTTATLAVAVPPVPPSVEVIAAVVLFCTPITVPVTFTENVQEAFIARFAPARLTFVSPALAVIVPAPHVPVSPLGVASTKPEGSASVTPIPLNATVAFGFVMVKLRLVVPFRARKAAPNVLVMVGGATTVRVAVLLVTPAPLSFAETAPVVFA